METIIGVIIGIIVTVLVGRYYFKRTINKSITPYIITNNSVFEGIEKSVRPNLKFTFREKEITNLHQVEFIVANDGEKAISQCIEPLSISFDKNIEILDTSILFKEPQDLDVKVENFDIDSKSKLIFTFPLLNKGDFFLVKLLLSGEYSTKNMKFNILVDDLPRTITPRYLSSQATKNKIDIEWLAVVVGFVLVFIAGAFSYALYLLYNTSPNLFPFIGDNFNPNVITIVSIILWCLGILLSFIIGLFLVIGIGFEEIFHRGPKFILPESMRKSSLDINILQLSEGITDLEKKLTALDKKIKRN